MKGMKVVQKGTVRYVLVWEVAARPERSVCVWQWRLAGHWLRLMKTEPVTAWSGDGLEMEFG